MALYQGSIRSRVLAMDTEVNVIIPEEHRVKPKAPARTLILLHGLKQNASAWVRMSNAEIYAHHSGFNIIIPEVQRSFYANMAYGIDYFSYIADELPQMMEKTFRFPMDREHLYVAGLSMGGYGALKCALTFPDRFAGAMSYSGGLCSLEGSTIYSVMSKAEVQAIIGMEQQCPDEDNLMVLAKKCAANGTKPWLYIACGKEDPLLPQSQDFAKLAQSLDYPLVYEEWPGVHDWIFWDRALARSLAYATGLNMNDVNPGEKENGRLK